MSGQPTVGLDRKGIAAFLLITFGVTWGVEILLIAGGARFELTRPTTSMVWVVGLLMLAPALAAFVTLRFITREGFGNAYLRFGNWKPYVACWLVIPACYAVIYLLTWALGLGGQPDWQFTWFLGLFAQSGVAVPPMPAPGIIWAALFFSSLVPGALFTTIFAFGEDFGWRGFLLPKLMPLGKPVAYTLMALIWSAWHWPLVLKGFTYPGYPVLGIVFFTLLTGTIGTAMNELTLRYRSCILPSWFHALFNTQKQGIWILMFPAINPLLGGYAGVVGLAVWGGLAAIVLLMFRRSASELKTRAAGWSAAD